MEASTPQPRWADTALPKGALGAWWAKGARSAFLQRVAVHTLPLTPAVLALLWVVLEACGIGVERLMIDGPARYYAPTMLSAGWLTLVMWLLCAWALVREGALAVVALLCAQSLTLMLMASAVLVPLARSGGYAEGSELLTLARVAWAGALLWAWLAQGLVLWRASDRPWGWRLLAILLLCGMELLATFYSPLRHWYPERPAPTEEPVTQGFKLTQEVVEAQSAVLARDLQALSPERRGHIDLYAITFAPDADEDVFLRESEMVAGVMRERFDAAGRTLQLVSRRDDTPSKAWATPLNLQRAIRRAAALMDREQDVLFLHLTSHGGRDGRLAASLWPLDVQDLTPAMLKAWLDEAGIRYRVISVSACYSGSWIAPLQDEHTLVMTAADAEHTSYGCGRGSPLTYFGRAVFDEQLRSTRSFEAAHAAARAVIEQREKEAGKKDGYSNPQLAAGAGVREQLRRLSVQLGDKP
jgi:hypothetical protein